MTATFAQLAPMTGRGLWWGLEISTDNFATVSYRWATHAGVVGGNMFTRRLVGASDVLRAFGQDHLPAAATVSLVIDNTDFGADWLVNRTTVASTVFKARFRLSVGLTSDTANVYQAEVITQKVGTFVCLDYPRRNDRAILLSLADDSLGQLADVLTAPSFKDWYQDAGTTTANSVFDTTPKDQDLRMLIDWNLPAPLQFGRWPYQAAPCCTFNNARVPVDFQTADGFTAGHRPYIYPILALATRSTAAIGAFEAVTLTGFFRKDVLFDVFDRRFAPLPIPQTFDNPARRIWKGYKTQTITKDGYSWRLLWIAFDVSQYALWMMGQVSNVTGSAAQIGIPFSPDYPFNPSAPPYVGTVSSGNLDPWFAAFEYFHVNGSPGSGIYDGAVNTNPGSGIKIMKDLVEYYSSLGAGSWDTTRFARAQLAQQSVYIKGSIFANGQGALVTGETSLSGKTSPYGIGTLRKAIGELAASADFEVFMTTDAKVAIVAQGADFETQTSTYPTIPEERIGEVEDKTPSQGERWSPYNRVLLQTSEGQLGPYDNQTAIDDWERTIAKVVPSKWWFDVQDGKPYAGDQQKVWQLRSLESVVRPIITFTTDMNALTLELGDYFKMSWSRGGNNYAHTLALWRVEGFKISPSKGKVQVSAVWMDDLQTDRPYLLDNETLLVRASPGAATLTVTTGSLTVVRSAGSFITAGVAAGDILRLKDSTEGATTFKRFRDVRVERVTDATHLDLVAATDTDFGAAGAHVIAAADWAMLRGATTYPDAVSDAANYPSGGSMYGKCGNGAAQFSDGSAANKLLDG